MHNPNYLLYLSVNKFKIYVHYQVSVSPCYFNCSFQHFLIDEGNVN